MFFGTQPDSTLFLPERMAAPELLIPGRKPEGQVEIDWTHPLTQRLVGGSIGRGPMLRPNKATANNVEELVDLSARLNPDGSGTENWGTFDNMVFAGADLQIICRFKVTSLASIQNLFRSYFYNLNTDNGGLIFRVETGGELSCGQLSDNTVNSSTVLTSASSVSVDTWYIGEAVAFDGGFTEVRLYPDGSTEPTENVSGNPAGARNDTDASNDYITDVGFGDSTVIDWIWFFDSELIGPQRAVTVEQLISKGGYQFLKPKTEIYTTYTPDVRYPLADARAEMPSLWIPKRKPVGPLTIDWEHPLADGLHRVFWWNGRAFEYLHAPGTDAVANPSVGDGASATPQGIYSNSDSKKEWFAGFYPTSGWGFTALTIYTPSVIGADIHALWYESSQASYDGNTDFNGFGGTGANREIHFGYNAAPTFSCQLCDNTVSNNASGPTGTVAANKPMVMAGRASIDRKLVICVDGNMGSETAQSEDNTRPAPTRYFLNNVGQTSVTNRYMRGTSPLFVSWDRPLTDAEMISVTKDPYQFLIPA